MGFVATLDNFGTLRDKAHMLYRVLLTFKLDSNEVRMHVLPIMYVLLRCKAPAYPPGTLAGAASARGAKARARVI